MMPDEIFKDELLKALNISIQKVAEREIEKSLKTIEAEIKEKVAAIAIRVAKFAEVEMARDRIIIKVDMKELSL